MLPRPPCLEQGLGPVHAEQETEIHVDGQPGGAEHVPKLPCVDVSKVAAAGHIGDEPAHPFPARGAVDGHVHEHVHTHGAHVRRGLVAPGRAHAFDARAVLGGERGDLFGLREALRDDDAVARLFGDERFEAEQVGGRGHDVLIAWIGAYFGLQRPLEQAHFRGKELLVGVEEFRIGKAFHLGREGGEHGVVHRAAYFSQRAQPVEVGLHGLGRVEEGLRVQLAVRRGQRTEDKGGVFTRTGFGVDHFGGGSEPGEGNFVAFDGVKADGRIGSKLHAVEAEPADGRRNSRGLRLLRAVDSMKLRHSPDPSFWKRVYDDSFYARSGLEPFAGLAALLRAGSPARAGRTWERERPFQSCHCANTTRTFFSRLKGPGTSAQPGNQKKHTPRQAMGEPAAGMMRAECAACCRERAGNAHRFLGGGVPAVYFTRPNALSCSRRRRSSVDSSGMSRSPRVISFPAGTSLHSVRWLSR